MIIVELKWLARFTHCYVFQKRIFNTRLLLLDDPFTNKIISTIGMACVQLWRPRPRSLSSYVLPNMVSYPGVH